MKNKLLRVLIVSILGLYAPTIGLQPAIAGSATGVKITMVDTRDNGFFLISVNGKISALAACASEQRMSIDANTNGGKILLANVLSAFHSGKTVNIQGTGQCSQWPGIESLYLLQAY
jgi:hypothetical protein